MNNQTNQFHKFNIYGQSKFSAKLKSLSRKVKRFIFWFNLIIISVSVVVTASLIGLLLIPGEANMIWDVVMHPEEYKALQNINTDKREEIFKTIKFLQSLDPDIRESGLSAMKRLERKLKDGRKKEIEKQFGNTGAIDKADKSGVSNVSKADIRQNGVIRQVTAYNSLERQTDTSPCIGAFGYDICKLYQKGIQVCATNAFAKGTILEIQNFGKCLVADRMNGRYKNRVDIFMDDDVARAKRFGKQHLRVRPIATRAIASLISSKHSSL